jgi:hypothetical protein
MVNTNYVVPSVQAPRRISSIRDLQTRRSAPARWPCWVSKTALGTDKPSKMVVKVPTEVPIGCSRPRFEVVLDSLLLVRQVILFAC